VLAAHLSAGPEHRLRVPVPVAPPAMSMQSRLCVTYAVLAPGPKGAGDGSRIRVLLWLGRAGQEGSGVSADQGTQREAHVCDEDRRSVAVGGLAEQRGVLARGN
jgi:hypothetical protein